MFEFEIQPDEGREDHVNLLFETKLDIRDVSLAKSW